MAGGLVMGALEKLYRQPSLFAPSFLATYEVSASPLQKMQKKSAAPPTLPRVQFNCALDIRLSRSYIDSTIRSRCRALFYKSDRYRLL